MSTEAQIAVLGDVCQERDRQESKWGQQDHHDDRWNTILGEEVGEAAQAVLDLNPGAVNDMARPPGTTVPERESLRNELIQVAAVAVAWVEAIDRRNT